MTHIAVYQIFIYVLLLCLLVKPMGWYMARVYEGEPCGLDKFCRPIENILYRICGIHPDQGMNWKSYLSAMLFLNLLGLLAVYLILRTQFYLPFNPEHFSAVPPDLAFNTAVSFASNTNWQAYGGEATLSYFSQMVGLTVQNFLSAATGMSLLLALIRGIRGFENKSLGNFWVDMVRSILYILLPLSIILAIFLSAQGVIQNLKPYVKYTNLQHTEQIIPMGPVASQVAIKQLGTNGGGFFNTNSAHPFENPTPLTNFFEMLAILLIPGGFCYTFGVMVKDKRQGWAIYAAMLIMFVPFIFLTVVAEQYGNPAVHAIGVSGPNMEGKETRFGIVNSVIWATATTAASNGSVNAMHDSFTPLAGMVPLWMMHLGEIVFGGVGSGLSGMLLVIIITVFVAGLMVGRTPEYLGKKIEPFEMKMASIGVLVMPLAVLLFTAIAVGIASGTSAIGNPGPHGLTEILYAFTSMTSNNGSAFAGLSANTSFYNILGGLCMLIGRYWIAIPAMAIAGSLVKKKHIPISVGTLTTHSPLFIILLVSVAFIVGALSFLPALALGPIIEELLLWGQYGY